MRVNVPIQQAQSVIKPDTEPQRTGASRKLRAEFRSAQRQLWRAMRKRGLRQGDDDAFDRAFAKFVDQGGQRNYAQALSQVPEVQRTLAAVVIDRAFLQRKPRTYIELAVVRGNNARRDSTLVERYLAAVEKLVILGATRTGKTKGFTTKETQVPAAISCPSW